MKLFGRPFVFLFWRLNQLPALRQIRIHHRSCVIGGNTNGERFFPVEKFSMQLGAATAETCNTYNMLILTRHLFSWEPSAETVDFFKRALFNQILASQHPAKGMENRAKYGDSIYSHDDHSLYVNLFIASELNRREKGLRVPQETKFPGEDKTRWIFKAERPVRLALKLRYPGWAASPREIGGRYDRNGI